MKKVYTFDKRFNIIFIYIEEREGEVEELSAIRDGMEVIISEEEYSTYILIDPEITIIDFKH